MLFYFFIQVLRILTKNVQSPGTISFRVSGNQPAKICQKSIRYGNINFEYYSIERLRANFCSLIKHAEIDVKTKKEKPKNINYFTKII